MSTKNFRDYLQPGDVLIIDDELIVCVIEVPKNRKPVLAFFFWTWPLNPGEPAKVEFSVLNKSDFFDADVIFRAGKKLPIDSP